jgi:hypothetical protein
VHAPQQAARQQVLKKSLFLPEEAGSTHFFALKATFFSFFSAR